MAGERNREGEEVIMVIINELNGKGERRYEWDRRLVRYGSGWREGKVRVRGKKGVRSGDGNRRFECKGRGMGREG